MSAADAALAPTAIVRGYLQFGGACPDTAALKNVLAQANVTAPHSGKPYSETLLFGLAGGLGGSYATHSVPGGILPMLGFRHLWNAGRGDFLRAACRRIGVGAEVIECDTPAGAESQVRRALTAGRPAVVWLDPSRLPHRVLPKEPADLYQHPVVVFGWDAPVSRVHVDDRSAVSFTVTPAQLAEARAGTGGGRLLRVEGASRPPDLAAALLEAIQTGCDAMLRGKNDASGLPGLDLLARRIADERDPKGWPTVFPPGPKLFTALSTLFHRIETAGTGGGAFRRMYASFLDESGEVLGKREFVRIAASYRELARRWTELARAALPDGVRELKKTRELYTLATRLHEERGPGAAPELKKLAAQQQAIEAAVAAAFPLDAEGVHELLVALAGRLAEIVREERAAATALARAAA